MMKSRKLFLGVLTFCSILIFVTVWNTFLGMNNFPSYCMNFDAFQTDIPIIILDEELLKKLENGECETSRKIKVGIEYPAKLEDSRFDVIVFKNETDKDYFELKTIPRRIIPKNFKTLNIGNVRIAENIPQFLEFLKRSTFIECTNMTISRNETGIDARKAVDESLSIIRDFILNFNMIPFLFGGTLLGWFRECSVIPHTNDFDFAIFVEDWNPEMWQELQKNDSLLKWSRKLGQLNDSLELTVNVKQGYSVHTDIFFMYTEFSQNETILNYVGGMDNNGQKYKYTYPDYDPFCAADLFGHIFWVTCSPVKQLSNEYGDMWYNDHPSSTFSWSSSHKNVKPNGKWTEKDMEQIHSTII